MYKLIRVTLLAIAISHNVDGKRTKSKKLTSDTEESTPKPSVLTYSNFGFNDVGSYDGFVPTSPDYATLLSGSKQETATRLYAPAFPTNLDTSGFGENYPPNVNQSPQSFDEQLQTSMTKYQPGLSYFSSPNFDNVKDPNSNKFIVDASYDQINNENNGPIYGSKLNSKQRNKFTNDFVNSDYNITKDELQETSNNEYRGVQNSYNYPSDIKQTSDTSENYPPLFKFTTTTVAPPDYENIFKSPGTAKFPRVIDFTNMNAYFSHNSVNNEIKNNGYQSFDDNSVPSFTNDKPNLQANSDNYFESDFKNNLKPLSPIKYNTFNNFKEEAQKYEKDMAKFNFAANQEFSQLYFNNKNKLKGKFGFSNDKLKKPWEYTSKDEDKKKSPIRYEYTTNHSSSSKYHPLKRPFNSSIDEISPASSNLDFYNYQHPDTDFGGLGSYASVKAPILDDNTAFGLNYPEKYKPVEDYQNSFKNFYTTLPTVTSHWGNLFKPTEFTSHKTHVRKPVYPEENDDIVHIPKRGKYGSQYDSNLFSDWPHQNTYKPYTQGHKYSDWKENTRYKSEEDLLGLRNHELYSSYPPSYKPYHEPPEDFDYKKLVDKWKHNYLKAKHKDTFREYETYASETKPIHVPVPKPYPIEVPHPVIVPVPQPYPVQVPVPKPVAIPVIRELTIPIEKPVPYPVYKKVPYPIEKPVPVPVEKQVHVPVVKPYPIAVPQVRPLFHHTRPHDDRDEEEDEYQPQPESSKRVPNVKRPKNKRRPARRPTRMPYQEREKRRPQRRPAPRDQRHRHHEHRRPPRHEDYEEYEPTDYIYCKRTGNC